MNKLNLINLLLITLFCSCQEPKLNFSMNMPDTMPPLLQIQTGLDPELKDEKVIFEKYIQTKSGDAQASRLYANGSFYQAYLDSTESLTKGNVSWEKKGVISSSGIDKIQKISSTSVIDYINDGPHERGTGAVENVNWYFYFDHPKFVQTQVRQWEWKWWQKPKFISKVNNILERDLTYVR